MSEKNKDGPIHKLMREASRSQAKREAHRRAGPARKKKLKLQESIEAKNKAIEEAIEKLEGPYIELADGFGTFEDALDLLKKAREL